MQKKFRPPTYDEYIKEHRTKMGQQIMWQFYVEFIETSNVIYNLQCVVENMQKNFSAEVESQNSLNQSYTNVIKSLNELGKNHDERLRLLRKQTDDNRHVNWFLIALNVFLMLLILLKKG